jgi:hypothetical protein
VEASRRALPGASLTRHAPGQAAEFLSEGGRRGRPEATGPAVEQLRVVHEELPIAEHRVPHEEERHRRLEWQEARVVDGRPAVAFVEGPEDDPVLFVGGAGELSENVLEEICSTLRREMVKTTIMVL